MNTLPIAQKQRVDFLIDLAWDVFFERVVSGRIRINKESSMQLHFAAILHSIGETFCTQPSETYSMELESGRGKQNIDITIALGNVAAAIELKCFKKGSNRAVDTDMYDVLKDIERLQSFDEFQVRRFICLTDNRYYAEAAHAGHAGTVSIKEGNKYAKGTRVTPSWIGKWKDKSRDKAIHIQSDLIFQWTRKDGWYALLLNI
jgi:hypothetical protein